MQFTTQHLDFLNRGFLATAWPHIADNVANEVLQTAWENVNEGGGELYVSGSKVEMNAVPTFAWSDSNLVLRAPATGRYSATLDVGTQWTGDVDIGIDLFVEMTINSRAPQAPVVQVEPRGVVSWLADLALDIEGRVRDGMDKHLGMFNTARFAPEAPLTIPPAQLLTDNRGIGGRGIDIVLVADGFTADRMQIFRSFADAFKALMTTAPFPSWLEPLASFDSIVRIWKIESICEDPGDRLQWATAHYYDSATGTEKTSAANVARIAALGVAAEAVGGDLIVFVSDKQNFLPVVFSTNRALRRRREGEPPPPGGANPPPPLPATPTDARASCVGRVIFEPISEGTAEQDVKTLVHEIGHSVLAGLADEYVEDSLLTTRYHGKEPLAPNVTAEPPGAAGTRPAKWLRWINNPGLLPPWDTQPICSPQGARYYGLGLWRPAVSCKMRDGSSDTPFCAVCREAFTLAMMRAIGEGYILLEYNYLSCEAQRVLVSAPDVGYDLAQRIRIPEGPLPFPLSAKIISCSLPKPWVVGCALTGSGTVNTREEFGCDFAPCFGDVLTMTVTSLCPFTPWDQLPTFKLHLRCDLPLIDVPQEAPRTPEDLTVHVHGVPGSKMRTKHVVLSAAAEDPNADDIKFEFQMAESSEPFTTDIDARSEWRQWSQAQPIVIGQAEIKGMTAGTYKFRARAVDATNRRSGWSAAANFVVPE